MYRFSRSIYRELAPRVEAPVGSEACSEARHQLLEACEETILRLATDHRYFAKPTQTLFAQIRDHFALAEQIRVYMLVERYVDLAVAYIESLPDDVTLNGVARRCPANTRQGTQCQRDPRPGLEYCPSHRHLEESVGSADEVPVAA